MHPIATVKKACGMTIKHERRLNYFSEHHNTCDTSIMATRGLGRGRGQGYRSDGPNPRGNMYSFGMKKPQCSHYGITGHSVDKCYKKYGYPPVYKPKYRAYANLNQFDEFEINDAELTPMLMIFEVSGTRFLPLRINIQLIHRANIHRAIKVQCQ